MGWGRGVQREQLTPLKCWGRRWQSSQAGQSRGMGAGWRHKGLGQEGPAASELLRSQCAWRRGPVGFTASAFLFLRAEELVRDQTTEGLGSLVYE